jgi:exonuclease SbcD
LGTQSRLADQFARIEEIVGYVEAERVDLVLVAGDVFDEQRIVGITAITGRLAEVLRNPLELGVQIVFVAGNHDRGHVFALLQTLKALVGPAQGGLVTFINEPRTVRLALRTGEALDLVCVPYPTPDRYGLDPAAWPSLEARQRALADAVRTQLRDLARDRRRNVPSVLCGHLLLAGVRGGYCGVSEEIPIDRSLPPAFAYVALGHIHRPQAIDDEGLVRYSGSLERMDLGEQSDAKSVVLVEIAADREVHARALPLHARPIISITADSRAVLEQRRRELGDPDGTLVFARLRVGRDQSLRQLVAAAAELFPLLYKHEVEYVDTFIEPLPGATFIRSDPAATVRAYLDEVLADDPEREALVALAAEVLDPPATHAPPL